LEAPVEVDTHADGGVSQGDVDRYLRRRVGKVAGIGGCALDDLQSACPALLQAGLLRFVRRAHHFLHLLLNNHLEGLCGGSAFCRISEGNLFEKAWIAEVGPSRGNFADSEPSQGVRIVADTKG
jgi:hypothetical protein